MTEDSALETFLKTHPEAKENDIFIFSWITGGDMEDIYARSGSSATPVFRDPEISEMVRELESAPPVPPPSNTQDDHTVHRANIDWLIESVDSPEPLPPPMQGRILKAAQISREDMWKPRRKRY